ncbi:MAG TPA: glycoside hydrolase family 127 protein [Vicinamibacterales bacterium]|nr:glycoside hydrolase family 127 protein [Vicinamibacterales bacterium]
MLKRSLAATAALFAAGLTVAQSQSGAPAKPDYPIKPVPFTAVHLNDDFWAPRIEINRTSSIPSAFEQCELTGRVKLFERAAAVLRGEKNVDTRPPGYPFDETDLYKVIEGASYSLSVTPDPKLDKYVDDLIAKIAAAQEPDGYIYTTRTIDPKNPHRWAGTERWVLERDDSHELYNFGHLFEAAVAHNLSTGKPALLNVAIKAADLLVATFGPGKRTTWPGHQITEMALVKLYRVTGKQAYLDLAKFLLDERGPGPFPEGEKANPRGLNYNQAHLKVIEQSEPVGHAVRAVYMYSGMADVAAVTGDQAMRAAGKRIWDHLITSKLYLTGGIGASGSGEAFGQPFELPNMTAYNETCASVGMDFWNHRLFLLEGDAKYIDVMERTLFNGLLSGVSLDGKTFFYPNPLESNGQHARQEWFGVACCPGNITRFMPSVPGYLYATRGDSVYVNLFAKGTANIDLPGGRITIEQDTRYPWDGAVTMIVKPAQARRFQVHVRIPGWARNEPVPSDLYRFMDPAGAAPTLRVNGASVPVNLTNGYATIDRTWSAGDAITLDLPMPVRRVTSNDQVIANRDRVALQRGPIVYAAEWADNPNGKVRNIVLPDANALRSEYRRDLLNGVQVITGRATGLAFDANGAVTKADQPFMAIPYAVWANRGRGQMAVWLARVDAAAKPTPFPTVVTNAAIAASPVPNGRGKNARNIIDGEEPASSADSIAYFDWWPVQGSKMEWVEVTFEKPSTVSSSEVYWFDDTGRGGVRVPASWRLLYKSGDQWLPVETTGQFGTARNAWNALSFKPVTTSALRVELAMQQGFSAGLQELKVK